MGTSPPQPSHRTWFGLSVPMQSHSCAGAGAGQRVPAQIPRPRELSDSVAFANAHQGRDARRFKLQQSLKG